jgi:hypothetical protein
MHVFAKAAEVVAITRVIALCATAGVCVFACAKAAR